MHGDRSLAATVFKDAILKFAQGMKQRELEEADSVAEAEAGRPVGTPTHAPAVQSAPGPVQLRQTAGRASRCEFWSSSEITLKNANAVLAGIWILAMLTGFGSKRQFGKRLQQGPL